MTKTNRNIEFKLWLEFNYPQKNQKVLDIRKSV